MTKKDIFYAVIGAIAVVIFITFTFLGEYGYLPEKLDILMDGTSGITLGSIVTHFIKEYKK